MRVRSRCLPLALALAVGVSISAQAAPAAAPTTSAVKISDASPAPVAANTLTLYSEPGLKGRHATYHFAAVEVERQGFVARSAASTGMWTLCEGGEVASRCQTVEGHAPALKFAPQLVRPGLNALALYEQPGLKGRRIVYSFAADRPAPFHARSARTWGGSWSLCERGFQRCQVLDGKNPNIDLVVGAVKPERAAAAESAALTVKSESLVTAKPPKAASLPVKVETRPTAKASKPIAMVSPKPKPLPAQARTVRAKAAPALRPLRPRKLIQVAARKPPSPPSPRHLVIQLSDKIPLHRHREARARAHGVHAAAPRAPRHSLLTQVKHRPARRNAVSHHVRELRLVHDVRPSRHAVRARMMHMVSDHPRRTHPPHRRLYRHVRMLWGGDPYLYDADPSDYGREPW